MQQKPKIEFTQSSVIATLNKMGAFIGAPKVVEGNVYAQSYPRFVFSGEAKVEPGFVGDTVLLTDKKNGNYVGMLEYQDDEIASLSQPPASNQALVWSAKIKEAQAVYGVLDKNSKESQKLSGLSIGFLVAPQVNTQVLCFYDTNMKIKRVFSEEAKFEKASHYLEKLQLKIQHKTELRNLQAQTNSKKSSLAGLAFGPTN